MVDKAQRAETERAILEATRAAHRERDAAQQAARGAKTVLRRAEQAVEQARAAVDAATNEAAKGMARGALRSAEAKEAEVRKEVGSGFAQQKAVEQAESRISALGQLPKMLAEARGETERQTHFVVPETQPKTTGTFFKIPVSDTQAPAGTFFKVPGSTPPSRVRELQPREVEIAADHPARISGQFSDIMVDPTGIPWELGGPDILE